MLSRTLLLVAVVTALILVLVLVWPARTPEPVATIAAVPAPAVKAIETVDPQELAPVPVPSKPRQVVDINVHTEEELSVVLQRVEALLAGPQPGNEPASIVLVLHGPEVAFYSVHNYARYKPLVDLTARLDAFNAIDVKMCQTRMKAEGIKPEEVPAFIEQVPYGPAEVERLEGEGFVRM